MRRAGRALGGAVMAVVIVVAVGCSAEPGPGSSTVRLQVSGEPEETAVYEAMATQFELDHPGTTVEVVKVPEKDDHLALLQTSFAAGDPADVFLINYREYAPFVERGAIRPVGPLLEERSVPLENYFAEPLDAFTLDGELQCMPQNVSSLVVYFNEDLFARAGIEPPFDGWTFEEFERAAQRLDTGGVRGVYVEPSLVRLAPFAWSSGGEVVDDTDEPTRLTLDDPRTRAALDRLVGLHRTLDVMPTPEEIAAQDPESRFLAGKLGMILSSRRDTPSFREVPSLSWDVLPLPTLGEPSTILHSDAYCLAAADGTYPELAADFVEFATGSRGQTLSALSGRTVPSLREVASSNAFLSAAEPPAHADVFVEGVAHMRRTPVVTGWPEIEDIASELLTQLVYDPDADGEELLAELDRRTRPLFEQ